MIILLSVGWGILEGLEWCDDVRECKNDCSFVGRAYLINKID